MTTQDWEHQPVQILLAEDNEDDIVLLETSFEEAKFVHITQVVRDGEEAMAYLHHQPPYQNSALPGLVLLDINMPKMNGFEVLESIKSNPLLKAIPVIMLTTSKREEDIIRSYQEGACSFISKPVDFQDFQKVIKDFELYWTLVATVPTAKN